MRFQGGRLMRGDFDRSIDDRIRHAADGTASRERRREEDHMTLPRRAPLLLCFFRHFDQPLATFVMTPKANGAHGTSTSSTYTPNGHLRDVSGHSIW